MDAAVLSVLSVLGQHEYSMSSLEEKEISPLASRCRLC